MERRFEIRKREILQQADIQPQVVHGMLKRLEQFAQPFIASFGRREPKENAHIYLCGLLSDLARKNIESIAYRYDRDRLALQKFIGTGPWDYQPLQTIVLPGNGLDGLMALAGQWLEISCTSPDWCNGVDRDQNGRVNLDDFELLAFNWLDCD